jgi:hypothetical protein
MLDTHLELADAVSASPNAPQQAAVAQTRSTPRTARRRFTQDSYRTSRALAEGRAVEDENYVKLRLSARRQYEQQQEELIDRRFREPDGSVQVWLQAKDSEVPYKTRQLMQSRKELRRLNAEQLERERTRQAEAKLLLKEINFLIERSAQQLHALKFSQKLLDEQRMKEARILQFEGRLKKGDLSLHLMGALRNVHRTLVMQLFKEVNAHRARTLYCILSVY